MSESKTKKKKKQAPNYYAERVITISVPAKVKDHLKKESKKVGLKMTAYIRMLLFQRLEQLGYNHLEDE